MFSSGTPGAIDDGPLEQVVRASQESPGLQEGRRELGQGLAFFCHTEPAHVPWVEPPQELIQLQTSPSRHGSFAPGSSGGQEAEP